MKKALALIAAAALMATAGTAMAKSIVDSKHNLSNYNPNNVSRNIQNSNGTQICVYCHTPHNGTGNLPLWNRNAPSQAANFVLYSGVGMANTSYKTFTNDSISLFCMSCHDGSQLGGNMIYNLPAVMPQAEKDAITNFTTGIAGNISKANIYANTVGNGNSAGLKSTHPVNFPVVSNSQADLAPVSAAVAGVGQTMKSLNNTGLEFPLYKSARSQDATFECSSCHAVHDDANAGFLRDTMANSKLCLGCHGK